MKTIIVNKNFNKKFMSRNIREIFMPRWRGANGADLDNPTVVNEYINDDGDILNASYATYIKENQQWTIDRKLSSATEAFDNSYNSSGYWNNPVGTNGSNLQNWVQPSIFYVVTQSYIDLIDKINTLLYNKQITLTAVNMDDAHTRFLNLVGAFSLTERRKAFAYVLSLGLITQEEYDNTATSSVSVDQLNWESFTMEYEEINDYYLFKHSTPMRLETRWLSDVNNPLGEQLYIMVDTPSTQNLNNMQVGTYGGGGRTNATKFFRADNNDYVYQYSYMAYTFGDLSSNSDIEFDHVDRMDYLDSIEVAIKLPRVYN